MTTKTLDYVICYAGRSPLCTISRTDEEGTNTISKSCDSEAVCTAADALFVALCAEAGCAMPVVPEVVEPAV